MLFFAQIVIDMNDDKLDFLKDDVKEVGNAKWLPIKKLDSHETFMCSNCGKGQYVLSRFCPDCGSRMINFIFAKLGLEIGDFFWEYNKGVGYQRRAHTQAHVDYFWKGYGKRAFFTKEELLATYPDATF